MPTNGKRPKYDLVGTAEAADILGIERSRIGRWTRMGLMPKPVVELKATPVWRRKDIEKLVPEREKRRRGAKRPDRRRTKAAA